MAAIVVTNTISATHGVIPLLGLREVSFDITFTEKEFGSDGGGVEVDAFDFQITGEAVFEDCQSYNTALDGVEADLLVVGRIEGGAVTRTFTAKNCLFTGARISLPTAQDRGVGLYRCPLRLMPGSSDTPQTMIVSEEDE